jgi:hypothetical protein
MKQWEYRSALLHAIPGSLTKNKGWKLRQIDEQELPNWKKTEIYTSVAAFCNQMGRQGWELISVNNHSTSMLAALYFKRPCTDETSYEISKT